jgi:hypothetical protein
VLLREGRAQVIDWERFSWSGIYGSDHWSLALKYWLGRERADWLDLWERRILSGTTELSRFLGPSAEAVAGANRAAKMAFVLQILSHNVAAVHHPAELGRPYVQEVAEAVRRLARLAEMGDSDAARTRRRAA